MARPILNFYTQYSDTVVNKNEINEFKPGSHKTHYCG